MIFSMVRAFTGGCTTHRPARTTSLRPTVGGRLVHVEEPAAGGGFNFRDGRVAFPRIAARQAPDGCSAACRSGRITIFGNRP